MKDFPKILDRNFATVNGDIYTRRSKDEEEWWQKIEYYLPSSEGTYNEPVMTTAIRWLDEFNDGVRLYKRWASATKYTLEVNEKDFKFKTDVDFSKIWKSDT